MGPPAPKKRDPRPPQRESPDTPSQAPRLSTRAAGLGARRGRQQSLVCAAIHRPLLPLGCFAPSTRVGFENPPSGVEITTQYASRGVTLGPQGGSDSRAPEIAQVGVLATDSGQNVLASGSCFSPACEFGGQAVISGRFNSPRKQVGMFVGDPGSAPLVLTLSGYDASSRRVAHTQATLAAGSPARRPIALVLGTTTARITRFLVSTSASFWLDDLGFR